MTIGILGAGVAGLAVAYFLGEWAHYEIHEAGNAVGGLARSFKWHGFDCDLGPHRFFTKDESLLRDVQALVPLRRLKRRSRIRLRGQWLHDPINIAEVLLKLMPTDSARIVWQYARRSQQHEDSFEALVLNNYGSGLNDLFFKPYSEKLFGIPSTQISATWGRRKIRVSGLRDLVSRDPRLYFRHFYYPASGGYGAIAARLHGAVKSHVHLESRVVGITPLDRGGYECRFEGSAGSHTARFDVLVSTLPLPVLSALLGVEVRLSFRPMTLLYLLVGADYVGDCHWTYFADRDVSVNRVAEFKHFGQGLPAGRTVLCCEITDTTGFSADKVVEELLQVGFLPASSPVLDTKIICIERAYPLYDRSFDGEIGRAEQALAAHPRIYRIGRQAQFAHKDVDEILESAMTLVATMRAEAEREQGAAGSLPAGAAG
jgi:protoporphyrinogen oxidase